MTPLVLASFGHLLTVRVYNGENGFGIGKILEAWHIGRVPVEKGSSYSIIGFASFQILQVGFGLLVMPSHQVISPSYSLSDLSTLACDSQHCIGYTYSATQPSLRKLSHAKLIVYSYYSVLHDTRV